MQCDTLSFTLTSNNTPYSYTSDIKWHQTPIKDSGTAGTPDTTALRRWWLVIRLHVPLQTVSNGGFITPAPV